MYWASRRKVICNSGTLAGMASTFGEGSLEYIPNLYFVGLAPLLSQKRNEGTTAGELETRRT